MNEDGLPVVDPALCTACGDCVEICPKGLFELMPVSQKLIVQCKSLLQGDLAEEKCSVACTGCGRCVADAPPGLIQIQDNLAVINYELNAWAAPKATWRCPTNAIVWVEGQQLEKKSSGWLPLGRVEQYEEEL
jgi:Fe-S-cluster-containing hydrogenase component 2